MKAVWSVIGVLALLGGERVQWEKPDNAIPVASVTGKPICWYFLAGEMVKGQPQAGC
jgi:hypothetical protein